MNSKRRDFLKISSVAALAAVAPVANAIPVNDPSKWDEEYDVVIIGAGGAGLAAAVEATKQGLSAIILEKEAFVGGSSALCGGSFALPGTDEQKARGLEDSVEKFLDDMTKPGRYKSNPELVKAYAKEALEHYNFITKELGIKPSDISGGSGMSVPRGHKFKPTEVLQAMRDYAVKKGVKISLNTKADRLTWDYNDGGFISGVKCIKDDKPCYIKANKGVLIATGGFSRGTKLLEEHAPDLLKAVVIGGPGVTGDGILMAQAYGADVVNISYAKATYGFTKNPKKVEDLTVVYYQGAIMLNNKAKRFANETQSYKLLADLALAQDKGESWLVFDEPIRQAAMSSRAGDKALFGPLDEGKDLDYIFRADTLEELAKKAELPVKDLEETIKRYNENIDKGHDPDFGRDTLNASSEKPRKIETPPFYIMPTASALIGTYGGLKIDASAQVIDVFGNKIPRLYAAGETTGGVHGSAYMSGTSWGKAMTFGRIAVKSMAQPC